MHTATPHAVAAATSTVSTPTPYLPTATSPGKPASTCSVTGAYWVRIAAAPSAAAITSASVVQSATTSS
nr:hypothetical protein [Leucobacter celer]